MSTSPNDGLWVELTCDGNRRAESEMLKIEGMDVRPAELDENLAYECYKAGGEATKKIVEAARDNMVGLIALWVWSTKNWDRPPEQARAVFRVTKEFLEDLRQNWIDRPENSDVRLVHMGRSERLHAEAPEVMELLDDITAYTRARTGMIVALLMDYSGPDEDERARNMWKRDTDSSVTYHRYLDLPRQGVPFCELDLRIRTGETSRVKHTNAVMSPYAGMETRDVFHEAYLPHYTRELFLKDLDESRQTEKRCGK